MITLQRFKGIAPRYAPQILPDNAAQVAALCKFESGALRPHKNNGPLASVAVDINAQTIHLLNRSAPNSSSSWLNFTTDTDIVRSPIAKDAFDRTYFSDGAKPKMKVAGNSTLYDLGIPSPITTATLVSADGTPDPDPPEPLDQENRYYVITYVSAYDEEGPPSSPIGPVVWSPGQHINLTSIPTGPGTGTTNIASKRIYRTNTGSTSTEYQLVATISAATTSFEDTVASNALGVVLPSVAWDAPPDTIKGFCLHPAGFVVGFSRKTIYCSELFLPHAWPYSYPVASEIVALAVYGNTILVMTGDYPYLLSGSAPDMLSSEKAEISLACISKRGVVDMGDTIYYPSPDGLVAVGLSETPNLSTADIMTAGEWSPYNTPSLVAAQWDGKYVGFNGVSGFVFNPGNKDFITITIDAEALFYDAPSGILYLKPDNATGIQTLLDGSTSYAYTWKSKLFRLDRPRNFGIAQVFADSYENLTFKVYAEGALKHTQVVTSKNPFRLPGGFLSDMWEFQLEGTSSVNAVHIAETTAALKVMA